MKSVRSPFLPRILMPVMAVLAGCYSGSGREASDAVEDLEVASEPDTADDPAEDPAAEDAAEEEEPVLPCTGGESLAIAYLDLEGVPVSGLAVALDSGGTMLEGTTDSTGRVTFEGLDFCNVPVHVTCVGESFAYTLTDIGQAGFVPDPLTITLEVVSWVNIPEMRRLAGNAVHSQAGSEMILSVPAATWHVSTDRYDLPNTLVGTNLHMSVMEFTGEPEARVPIGYALLHYDTPPEGTDGPDAEPRPAEFQTASVRLEYDIAADSPFHEPLLTDPRQEGIFMRPGHGQEDVWSVGFQTTWTRGEDFDTLEAAWTEEAMAEVVDPNFYVSVWAYSEDGLPLWEMLKLPNDPDSWNAVTVHDVAVYTNADYSRDPEDAEPFDYEFNVDPHPSLQVVSHMLSAYDKVWHVEGPAQRSTISFASLPWPSSIDQSEFFADPAAPAMTLLLKAASFDENPFNNYVRWSTWQWGSHHYRSITWALMYFLQLP